MNCQDFQARLDAGDAVGIHEPLAADLAAHAEQCAVCQHLLDEQKALVVSFSETGLGPERLKRLQQRILAEVAHEEEEAGRPWWQAWIPLSPRSWALGLAFMLCLGVLLWQVPLRSPTRVAPDGAAEHSLVVAHADGPVYLFRDRRSGLWGKRVEEVVLTARDRLVTAADRPVNIAFNQGGIVTVQGVGSFRVQPGMVFLRKGKVNMLVAKMSSGFRIRTPHAVIGILGTRLAFEVTDDATRVDLQEGHISWHNLQTGSSGRARGGETLHFGTAGPADAGSASIPVTIASGSGDDPSLMMPDNDLAPYAPDADAGEIDSTVATYLRGVSD